jgi:hypothetical protein
MVSLQTRKRLKGVRLSMKQAAVYVQGQGSVIAGWLDMDDRYIIIVMMIIIHL